MQMIYWIPIIGSLLKARRQSGGPPKKRTSGYRQISTNLGRSQALHEVRNSNFEYSVFNTVYFSFNYEVRTVQDYEPIRLSNSNLINLFSPRLSLVMNLFKRFCSKDSVRTNLFKRMAIEGRRRRRPNGILKRIRVQR